jgi:Spy/CpxP family protein refolding chaperone
MALEKAQSKHDIWQILTPEQQTQLKGKMAKHAAKKRHGKKHGGRKSPTATG